MDEMNCPECGTEIMLVRQHKIYGGMRTISVSLKDWGPEYYVCHNPYCTVSQFTSDKVLTRKKALTVPTKREIAMKNLRRFWTSVCWLKWVSVLVGFWNVLDGIGSIIFYVYQSPLDLPGGRLVRVLSGVLLLRIALCWRECVCEEEEDD